MSWKDEKDLNRQITIRKVLAFNSQSTAEFAWHASHALSLTNEKRKLKEGNNNDKRKR